MAYRNKTYVAFDGENDIRSYYLMRAWKANENIDFDFYDAHDLNTIGTSVSDQWVYNQLRERMASAKQLVLLVGENTKFLRKFVRWEIELARKKDIPIVVANLNGCRTFDEVRCPSTVKDGIYTMHVSFRPKIIKYALDAFVGEYVLLQDKDKGHNWHYNKIVYDKLGL